MFIFKSRFWDWRIQYGGIIVAKFLVSLTIISIPNIQSLHFNPFNIYAARFIPTNYEPKVEVPTVFFRFEYHIIGTLFRNIRGNGETFLCVESSIKLFLITAENPIFSRTYMNQILCFSRLLKIIKKAEEKDKDR